MSDIYDDEELAPVDGFNNVTFSEVGDRFRGQVIRMEKIPTRFGKVAKFWLFDLDDKVERTMLAGQIDLWRQLHSLRVPIGNVVDIELVGFEGRMQKFQVNDEGPLAEEPF